MIEKPKSYSIRSYLEELRRRHPDQLVEIEDEITIDYEPTAYYLALRKKNPVILFKKIRGFSNYNLVTNLFGSMERLARLAGFGTIDEAIEKWPDISNSRLVEQLSIDGDVNEVFSISEGTSVNVFNIPVPSHYPQDGSNTGFSRYITSGLTTTRDPADEGTINLSFARIQLFEKGKFAFDAGSHGHLWSYLRHSMDRGKRLRMTVLVGPNPIFYLLAASFIDNEFSKASRMFNIRFVPGYGNDIPIPFDTEIAIEAEFIPGETFDEGPFAEYAGYMGYDSTKYVAEIKSILTKPEPIYFDIQPSNSSEHVNLFSVPRTSIVMRSLREALPKGPEYKVSWPHYGGRFMSLAYVDRAEPGLAKQLGFSILGADPLWNKIVFVNEGKTDLTIEAALANLAQSRHYNSENVSIVSNMFVISSDPTRDNSGNTGKIVFVTEGKNQAFERAIEEDSVVIRTVNGTVVISHDEPTEGKVRIMVPKDIDLRDFEQVGWVMATRLNPTDDITIERDHVTFRAIRKVPPVARLPDEVKERIWKRAQLFTGRFA